MSLKIIDSLAVAVRKSDGVGYAISHEATHTKAYKTRFETIRDWARCKDEDVLVVSNKPTKGFAISDSFKRSSYFGSGNTIWRIKDPRGFELELYSEAFAKLLSDVTIINGDIQNECYWSKSSNNWVLIPLNSDVHKEYLETVNISQKDKLTLSELRGIAVGTHVVIRQNNVETVVIFLGEHYFSTIQEVYVKESLLHTYVKTSFNYEPLWKHNNKSFFFADIRNSYDSGYSCSQYKSPEIVRVLKESTEINDVKVVIKSSKSLNISKGNLVDVYDTKLPENVKYLWKDIPRKYIDQAITNSPDLVIESRFSGGVAYFIHVKPQPYYPNKVYNPKECTTYIYPVVGVIISEDLSTLTVVKTGEPSNYSYRERATTKTNFIPEDTMVSVLCYNFNGNDYIYETDYWKNNGQ